MKMIIRNFSEFSKYKYQVSNENIFSKNLEFGISGIKYDSKTLLVLPRNNNLSKLSNYQNLNFVEFNNYELSNSEIKYLSKNKAVLEKVKYLSFWNTKLVNLEILKYFENIECLNIAHISDRNFNFKGIEYLKKLRTLCLLKTGKLEDISSIGINDSIENLSIIQPTNIKSTVGIKNLTKLKYLNIEGSFDKTYEINNLEELSHLSLIEEIEFHRIKLNFEELIKLEDIPTKIKLDLDTNLFPAKKYKELSLKLKNVVSPVFYPYIDKGKHRDFIIPVGKGKRIIKKSDKKFKEKIEKLITEWNN